MGGSEITERLLHRLYRIVHETVFPGRCLVCGRFFSRPHRAPEGSKGITGSLGSELCAACLQQITQVESPMCSVCGLPFASRQGLDHACGQCIRTPGFFTMARAALVYDRALKRAIHCFKYQGKTQLAGPLGEILLAAFQHHWDPQRIDLVVPVPLHPKRMRRRGFNQAYLLLRRWGLPTTRRPAAHCGPVLYRDLIIRTRYTAPQTTLNRRQRAENIKNAFALTDFDSIRNRTILLVDDVYTTGATAGECARLLLDKGARRVDILTLARAVLPA